MKSKKQIKIVMDDGGGIALAVYADKYAHLYDNGSQLADDLILLRDEGTTDGWDNNEWDTGITRSDQSCRDYFGTPQQIIDQVVRDYNNDDVYGANHQQLAKQLIRQ
jgi:hypothetical protein